VGSFYALGIDPGFANVGFALCKCSLLSSGTRVVEPVKAGLIRTEKSEKKLSVLASNDNTRRMREIAHAVDSLLGVGPEGGALVRVICAESMSFPRNAGSAAKMAMSWGVLAALAHVRQAAVFQASPMQIKVHMCGKKTASKEDIREAVDKATDGVLVGMLVDHRGNALTRKEFLEHPYDAMAAVLTCLESEALQFAWR